MPSSATARRVPNAPEKLTDLLNRPALLRRQAFLAGAWAENADYLKVRLISLNYRLPERWYSAGKIRSIDVGFRIVNPFNFVTSSFDPEVTGINTIAQGGLNVGVF
ncbi:MAG: hypothetical protein WD489_01175, partial [Rhodovibrionaceae bacterium]